MTTEQTQSRMIEARDRVHRDCIVCGRDNACGLKVRFQACDDGSVEATFRCGAIFQGYAGLIHGGVISSLLDGAMIHCLFASGKPGVTGKLTVGFLFPVMVGRVAVVRAWVKSSDPPLHTMESELIQDSRVVARATAKFMECTDAFLAERSAR